MGREIYKGFAGEERSTFFPIAKPLPIINPPPAFFPVHCHPIAKL